MTFDRLVRGWEDWRTIGDVPQEMREEVASAIDKWKASCLENAEHFPDIKEKQLAFARAYALIAEEIRR